MRHGSLFSGIGGFDLASEWMGWTNVFHCEINEFCRKVLKQHFPDAATYTDITTTDFSEWQGRCDIVTGGFPCQPFSIAGKRKGVGDDRFLWKEMLRAIKEVQPRFVVAENVPGLLDIERGMVFKQVCSEMEIQGYEIASVIIPAASKGAWHKRDRLWIVAENSNSIRCNSIEWKDQSNIGQQRKPCAGDIQRVHRKKNVPDPESQGLERRQDGGNAEQKFAGSWESGRPIKDYWKSEPELGRVANGISNRVDRTKALGNAIVPQVAYEIFKAIEDVEKVQP